MTMKLLPSLSLSAVVFLAVCAYAQDAPPDTTAALPSDSIPPAPVSELSASDYVDNSDAGDKIELLWELSPDDGDGMGDVASYQLWRSEGDAARWDSLGIAAAGQTRYVDETAEPGVDYHYGIAAFDGINYSEQVSFGPVAGRANLFQSTRISVLVLMLVFFGMVLVFRTLAEQGADLFVRRIPGLNAIEEAVGRATEMGRPVLYVPGIGEIDNIMTIASLTILSHVAKITARYETPLIVPTARAVVMSAAEEVVKEAYAAVGKPDGYNPDNIRYLSDAQFAFAGAVNGIMLREKPAANLYMGAFWAESLLLAETGFEAGAIQVAGTAMVSQLPFFVTACDFTLMGEELYAASAYLSREPKLLGGLKGSDWMKVLSITLMAAGVILYMFNPDNAFVAWFSSQ
ncbi:MAG: fibronectin type III domain-containing protein [Candidatus Eisenbacteria sp.]|nr:fibronectin type III domain-containing protein [Candidatus Eisenbacteria bacterium]